MKTILLGLCLLAAGSATAQEAKDTTLFVNQRKITIKEYEGKLKVKVFEPTSQGDTIENAQIFEGIYKDGTRQERRISFSVPFTRRSNYKRSFRGHFSGIYAGFSSYGSSDKSIELNSSKSWEWGINLTDVSFPIIPSKELGFVCGLGWGYTSFRLDNDGAFVKGNEGTQVEMSSSDLVYTKSRLRYNFVRIPFLLEYQSHTFHYQSFSPFVSAGIEAEIRYGIKSKAEVNGNEETLGKGMNVRPIGLNLMAQAGIGNLAAYIRYSLLSTFEGNKGPDMNPCSIGISWCW